MVTTVFAILFVMPLLIRSFPPQAGSPRDFRENDPDLGV
jgi:hypothetical protein